MVAPSPGARAVRFGSFELDLQSRELRKDGHRVGLQDQPLQVLTVLLEHPGELVTREELRQRLWPADTYVDFEHGLNAAVKRLRDALGDSADAPRFIETVPRRGYRFLASVNAPRASNGEPTDKPRRRVVFVSLSAAVIAVLLFAGWVMSIWRVVASKSPQITSVAVLPLKNLTGDAAQEYFADGMTDALSATFSQLGGLTVVSSTSSKRYKDSSRPAPQIAQELGVDALLEGTVLRSGTGCGSTRPWCTGLPAGGYGLRPMTAISPTCWRCTATSPRPPPER